MFDTPSILDPRGPGAADIAELTWIIFALGAAVFVWVMVVLGIVVLRRRRVGGRSGPQTAFILISGAAIPAVILAFLMFLMVRIGDVVALPGREGDVRIEVIGHKFWWEVRYPDHGVVTANEIHIPAGSRIELTLKTEDVIHSFWVPQLQGKTDMTPGMVKTLAIQADEPGVYRGACAEYCGVQHARMAFVVIAQTPTEFERWAAEQRRPARDPQTDSEQEGLEVYLGTTCVACHAIEGTPATAEVGPDLTHIASRRTLFAAQHPNTREYMREVIVDPHRLKPGVRMPPTDLPDDELEALLDYLESLR
jgi:cytochrome c oxidase subunit II